MFGLDGSTLARPRRPRASHRALHVLGKRIVAAGVENDEPQLLRRLDGDEDTVEPDGLVIDVGIVLQLGIDRNEVIVAVDLDAVTGVIDDGDVGAAGLGAEIPQRPPHVLGRQVVAGIDDGEAGLLEGLDQKVGVVGGVGELGRALIGRIAHHQRHALVGECSGWLEDERQSAENKEDKRISSRPPSRDIAKRRREYPTGAAIQFLFGLVSRFLPAKVLGFRADDLADRPRAVPAHSRLPDFFEERPLGAADVGDLDDGSRCAWVSK